MLSPVYQNSRRYIPEERNTTMSYYRTGYIGLQAVTDVKLYLCQNKNYRKKICERVEGQFHAFFVSALDASW
jgi:hypothetical protein